MRHPNYVWMVHNWYNIDWWTNETISNCTIDEMQTVLNLQIILDHFPRINEEDKNKTNIGGVVSKQAAIKFFPIMYLEIQNVKICVGSCLNLKNYSYV